MAVDPQASADILQRIGIFVIFLIGGLLIFVFGSSYYSTFWTNRSLLFKLCLPVVFALITLLCALTGTSEISWRVPFAFVLASSANFLSGYLGPKIEQRLGLKNESMRGIGLMKLCEAVLVIGTILVLAAAAGEDFSKLFFQPGDLVLGVGFGFGTLAVFVGISFLQLKSMKIGWRTVRSKLPWMAVFALANAMMEEVWFRGIFLDRFESLLGMPGALFLTAIVFTAAHIGATYLSRAERLQFLIVLFPLAIGWGYLMQVTDSLIGPVLSHAGADLIVLSGFIATFSGRIQEA